MIPLRFGYFACFVLFQFLLCDFLAPSDCFSDLLLSVFEVKSLFLLFLNVSSLLIGSIMVPSLVVTLGWIISLYDVSGTHVRPIGCRILF